MHPMDLQCASRFNPGEAQTPSLSKLFGLARPELPKLFLMVTAEWIDLILPLIIANAYHILVDPTHQ